MAVVADFRRVVGDSVVSVPVVGPWPQRFEVAEFLTNERLADPEQALLICSVRNLAGSAEVRINDEPVGTLTSAGANWTTQVIAVSGSELAAGSNELNVTNVTDGFQLKDVFCFFHQNS